jgi:hypothetical protein
VITAILSLISIDMPVNEKFKRLIFNVGLEDILNTDNLSVETGRNPGHHAWLIQVIKSINSEFSGSVIGNCRT